MRWITLLLVAVFAAAAGSPAARAERRVALVIGNGSYAKATALPNPARDAAAVADMLQTLGFEVVQGTDLGRDGMIETLGRFARLGGGADVALFYYAGHGLQIAGRNYLVPVDADLRSELDAKARTVDIDAVLQDSMADAKVRIILLDACRDNPFAQQIAASAPRSRAVTVGAGLAEMRSGEGTLIAFATGPGQVASDGEGEHSPFARAILTHLPTPGLEIRLALTQVRAQVAEETRKQQLPWENTNLTGFFFMRPGDAGQPVAAALPAGPGASAALDPAQLELALWNGVKESTNPEEYRAYLARYPSGVFSDLARARISSLQAGDNGKPAGGGAANAARPPPPTEAATQASEDALGLDKDAWKSVQGKLSALGYGSRSLDGRPGKGTRRAVSEWQAARGYPVTGFLDRVLFEILSNEVAPERPPPAATAAAEPAPPRKPRPQKPEGGRPPAPGGPNPAAVGEFIGGVVRGATGIQLPF